MLLSPSNKGYKISLFPFRRNCDSTPAKLLLFARKKDLRMHQLENSDVSMVIPVDGIRSAVALAWDSNSDSVFWTDIEADTINRAHLNGSWQRAIVSSNLGKDCAYTFLLFYNL